MEKLKKASLFIAISGIMLGAIYSSILILMITVGILVLIRLYIYKRYRDMGETGEFWEQTSKPLLVAVLTIFLLLILEHYNIFESLSKLL